MYIIFYCNASTYVQLNFLQTSMMCETWVYLMFILNLWLKIILYVLVILNWYATHETDNSHRNLF